MQNDTAQTATLVVPAVELVPQPHGGALRRGNPGNKGRAKSQVAREILQACTPKLARILKQMAESGVNPTTGRQLSDPDHIKAVTAALDRGDVPVRTELTGADGAAITVLVGAAAAAHADD